MFGPQTAKPFFIFHFGVFFTGMDSPMVVLHLSNTIRHLQTMPIITMVLTIPCQISQLRPLARPNIQTRHHPISSLNSLRGLRDSLPLSSRVYLGVSLSRHPGIMGKKQQLEHSLLIGITEIRRKLTRCHIKMS